MVKYRHLAASASTVIFTGAGRSFTGIIMHGRAEKVGKVGYCKDVNYRTVS